MTAAQTERLHCNFALALWPTSGLSGPWPFTSILRQYSVMEINPILAFDNQMNKAIHRASPVYSQIGHMGTGLACTAAGLHATPCRPSRFMQCVQTPINPLQPSS